MSGGLSPAGTVPGNTFVFQKGLEKYINTFLNGIGFSLLMNIHFGTVGY